MSPSVRALLVVHSPQAQRYKYKPFDQLEGMAAVVGSKRNREERSPLVTLGETSALFKEWRRRGEESLGSPGAVVASSSGKDGLAASLLEEALARAEDDGSESEAVSAARGEVEASVRRLAAAEAKRASAEAKLRARSRAIRDDIAAGQAAAMGDEEVADVSSLVGCALLSCRAAGERLEAVLAVGSTRLGIVLVKPDLRLESAHLAHDVVDVADLLAAAARERPPNDIRLVIRETAARVRQLDQRKRLVEELQQLGPAKVHATDDCYRITLIDPTFSAVFLLPHAYPDHPPSARVTLASLALARRSTQVECIRRRLDDALAAAASIPDVLHTLRRDLVATDSPTTTATLKDDAEEGLEFVSP